MFAQFDFCIYIPRVSGFYAREDVKKIISTNIANVTHIDCVNIPNPHTNYPRMVDYDFSAFIHISAFHDTEFAQNVLARMETNGSYEFEFDEESWFLVKYRLDQPSDGAATIALEEILMQNSAQQRAILRLESIVQNQSSEIHRIQRAIYQMLGHCFDHQKASESKEMFGIYNMMMHSKQVVSRWMHDENDDGTEKYEREFFCDSDVEREDEIPEPESTQKGKSNSPLSLIDGSASVIPVPDRLKNTAELCGNN